MLRPGNSTQSLKMYALQIQPDMGVASSCIHTVKGIILQHYTTANITTIQAAYTPYSSLSVGKFITTHISISE